MQQVIRKNDKSWNLFADYFALCKGMWAAQDTDEYYQTIIKKADEVYNKYADATLEQDGFDALLVRKLAVDALDLAERKGIEARKEAEALAEQDAELELGA